MEELSIENELKKHYLKRNNVSNIQLAIENEIPLYSKFGINDSAKNNFSDKNIEKENKSLLEKYRNSLLCRTIASLIIFILVLCYKYYPENIKKSKIVSYIKSNYTKNYDKFDCIESFEEICKKCYLKLDKVVPEKVYLAIVEKYVKEIKPRILKIDIDNIIEKEEITVAVFNEEDFKIVDSENTPIEEAIETNSEISLMALDVEEILSKNISIVQPVNGTVTSLYGAREEILAVVGYHTGIDIANAYNTQINSATDGKVIKAELNNFYYGNNVEIENDGVVFKYAHMNKILVNEGDNVKQNQVIGLMGATGQATGSHLHFEIRINGRTVDPEMVLEIK